jgi:hypothetical protein
MGRQQKNEESIRTLKVKFSYSNVIIHPFWMDPKEKGMLMPWIGVKRLRNKDVISSNKK